MRSGLLRALHIPSIAPIIPTELLQSGAKAWPSQFLQKPRGGPSTLKIGICVSGGPDSMCLAYLLKRLNDEQLLEPLTLDLTAFIVDHKARDASTAEAEHVSRLLRDLSINSRILTLTWPQDVDPLALSNFESRARDLRFDLLSLAAVETGLQRLFLGHHEGDQYETLLFRLRPNHGRLQSGIQPSSNLRARNEIMTEMLERYPAIAKCLPAAGTLCSAPDLLPRFPCSNHHDTITNTPSKGLNIFSGLGVTLHRPLLRFPKARILATCATYGIPYVTDPTNFDVCSTPRNAIRSMLAKKTLPRALSKVALIKMSKEADLAVEARKEGTVSIAHAVGSFRWDLRSAQLVVELPTLPGLVGSLHPRSSQDFLRQLLELVTPLDGFEKRRQRLESRLAKLDFYNEEPRTSKAQQDASRARLTLNVAGCVLEPCQGSYATCRSRHYHKLRIYRQPFKTSEIASNTLHFDTLPGAAQDGHTNLWSRWLLWDNRYWLRICCSSLQCLQSCVVRPLMESDIGRLRSHLKSLSPELLRRFESILADAAPGSVRYTLPILEDQGVVRAFPTLDFVVPDAVDSDGGRAELISWRIMYKEISREMMELVGKVGRDSEEYQEKARRSLNHA